MCNEMEEAGPDAEWVVLCLDVPKYLDFERAEVRNEWVNSRALNVILERAMSRWPKARKFDVCANDTWVGGWHDHRGRVGHGKGQG